MRILLSNDDGALAIGLNRLYAAVSGLGEITVVAPDRNRSGASNSLTLQNPLRMTQLPNNFYSLDGTPTDCVHFATTGYFDEPFDMVLSGINAGANLGDDVLYSGTVAAAIEGRFLGHPAIAFSLAAEVPRHWDTAAVIVQQMMKQYLSAPLDPEMILNVNIPDLPLNEIKGVRGTRLGHRHLAEPVIKDQDPRGRPLFWIGPAGKEADAGEGTDFHAIKNGYVSVTPLTCDLTHRQQLNATADWAAQLLVGAE